MAMEVAGGSRAAEVGAPPAAGPVPVGELRFFTQGTCPGGWTESTAYMGYLLMGRPNAATPDLFRAPYVTSGL